MVGRKQQEEMLRAEGIDGKAKLGEWWIIGKSGGELEMVEFIKFELELTVSGRSPYNVMHKQLTPYGVYSRLSKGMILPVKVHPEKPKKLLLDWDQFGAGPQVQILDGADLQVNVVDALKDLGITTGKKDLKGRLSELEELYKEGLITKDEYDNKKAEILKDL